jgi:hypothetical protein
MYPALMKSIGSSTVLLAATLNYAVASNTPKEVGSIQDVKILEIQTMKKLSEHVGKNAIDSKIEIEITGMYEGNAQEDTLVGRIESAPGSSSESLAGELKLYSINTKEAPMQMGSRFRNAVSSPTPFRVVVELSPTGWGTRGNAYFSGPQTGMAWGVFANVVRHKPFQHVHQYGFGATLTHSTVRKDWSFRAYGFEPAP